MQQLLISKQEKKSNELKFKVGEREILKEADRERCRMCCNFSILIKF